MHNCKFLFVLLVKGEVFTHYEFHNSKVLNVWTAFMTCYWLQALLSALPPATHPTFPCGSLSRWTAAQHFNCTPSIPPHLLLRGFSQKMSWATNRQLRMLPASISFEAFEPSVIQAFAIWRFPTYFTWFRFLKYYKRFNDPFLCNLNALQLTHILITRNFWWFFKSLFRKCY
jgi:hypothetical protein